MSASEHPSPVLKNTVILCGAEVFNILCGIVLIIALARVLGPFDLGLFSFAYSLGTVIYIVGLYGINDHIVREVARDPRTRADYFAHAVPVRVAVIVLCIIVLEVVLQAVGYPAAKKLPLYALMAGRIIESLLYTFYAFFRASQKMIYEGILRVMLYSVALASGLAVLFSFRTLAAFAVSQVLVYAVFFIVTALACRSFVGAGGAAVPISVSRAVAIARESFHLSLVWICTALYVHINTILLTFIRGESATGIYAAAFRFVSAFGFVAASFTAAVFPAMARAGNGAAALMGAYRATAKHLFIMALFISAVLATLGGALIRLVYGGAFAAAALPLLVMSCTPLFSFLNTGSAYLLFAADREKTYLAMLVSSLAVAVVLNAILLAPLGPLGAALTTILPEVVFTALLAVSVGRLFGARRLLRLFNLFLRPAIAGAAAAILMYVLRDRCHVVIAGAAGALLYLAALIITGAYSRHDGALARGAVGLK